jgi:hypothetical protein
MILRTSSLQGVLSSVIKSECMLALLTEIREFQEQASKACMAALGSGTKDLHKFMLWWALWSKYKDPDQCGCATSECDFLHITREDPDTISRLPAPCSLQEHETILPAKTRKHETYFPWNAFCPMINPLNCIRNGIWIRCRQGIRSHRTCLRYKKLLAVLSLPFTL